MFAHLYRNRAGCSGTADRRGPRARLLIIALQILGHIIVDDEPDVGLVNAHAEGVGRHHDLNAVVEEVVLILPAHLGVQLGVVGRRPDAPALEQAGRLVHLLRSAAIDDPRIVALPEHKVQQLLRLLAGQGAARLEVKVGSVEAGRHLIGLMEFEVAADVVPHPGRRRGRERAHHRAIRQAVHELLDAQIAGRKSCPHWLMQWPRPP